MDDKIIRVPEQKIDFVAVRIDEFEGIVENLVNISADYQALPNDRYIIADTACTVTLPVINRGKIITVKNTAAAGTVSVDGGDYNIDGAATYDMATQYYWSTLVFNGTEWNNV